MVEQKSVCSIDDSVSILVCLGRDDERAMQIRVRVYVYVKDVPHTTQANYLV